MGNYYSTTSPPKYQKFGWKPDLPDHRDKVLKFPRLKKNFSEQLPSKVDLRDEHPPIYNQGKLGSCTAHAIATAYQFCEKKEGNKENFMPSRLFIYYNERKVDDNLEKDAGGSIRDGIKSINCEGVCSESIWKYDITKFRENPPKECYQKAVGHQSLEYFRILQCSAQIKQALNSGYPIIFGMSVFDSFISDEVTQTGMIPMPKDDEKLLGGHAVLLVGYDDEESIWICRNSFGEEWGDKGHFYLPYEFLLKDKKFATDFWMIKKKNAEKMNCIELQ